MGIDKTDKKKGKKGEIKRKEKNQKVTRKD